MPTSTDPKFIKLFHAIYSAVSKRSSQLAAESIGSGLPLTRNMDGRYAMPKVTGGGPPTIDLKDALGSITGRDGTKDGNRFTGIGRGLPGLPAPSVTRGGDPVAGIYTSQDHAGLFAEMHHYLPGTPGLTGNARLISQVASRCFVKLRTVRELIIADLDTSKALTARIFDEIGRDPDVADALRNAGYSSLEKAVFDPVEYTGGRALGLGLASNPEIDGFRVTSAREFPVSGVGEETGNNVVLFGQDMKPATGLVQVASLHLIQATPGSPGATVSRFEPSRSSGDFEQVGAPTPIP